MYTEKDGNQPRLEPSFALSGFAEKRNTPESPRSHYEGSTESLLKLVAEHFRKAKPGYKDGVCLVPVPPDNFKCTTVPVTDDLTLNTTFSARREGEEPFLKVTASGEKALAKAVDIVLYSREVLLESGEESSGADWEIVTMNARLTLEEEPMDPVTMARNHLELPGGSKGGRFSADEFANAIIFWSKHVAIDPDS